MTNELRHALHASLSGIRLAENDKRQILRAIREEKQIVKKKLSFVFVLVLALVLVALTALAVTQWEKVLDYVFVTEREQGRFDDWAFPQKDRLIQLLGETGMDMSDFPDIDGLAQEKANHRISQWVAAHFSGEVASLHYTMLEKAKGHIDTWSDADKAWYSGMLLEARMYQPGDDVYATPTAATVKKEQAIRLTQDWLLSQEGLTADDMARLRCYAS